ncbi:MAG: hypothetical protein ACREP9_18745 [Candidatus Dormibacteraceae bacterium]
MLLTFTVVPLSMTAAEKFNEAAYFYDRMRETVANLREFPFNLSAFLAAARSTTLFLQKQYSGVSRFDDWYRGKQTEMTSDPDLLTLNKLRVETVHIQPVSLTVQAGPTLPADGVEIDGIRGGYLQLGSDPDGTITTPYRLNADMPIVNAKPRVRWLLGDESGPDIRMVCGNGLIKIKAVLDEWYRMQPPSHAPDLSETPSPVEENGA